MPIDTLVEPRGLKHRTYRITPYSMLPRFTYLSSDNKALLVANQVGDSVEFTKIMIEDSSTEVLFTRAAEEVRAIEMEPDSETLVLIGDHGIEELHLPSGESTMSTTKLKPITTLAQKWRTFLTMLGV